MPTAIRIDKKKQFRYGQKKRLDLICDGKAGLSGTGYFEAHSRLLIGARNGVQDSNGTETGLFR
jgi:hypothetical protein